MGCLYFMIFDSAQKGPERPLPLCMSVSLHGAVKWQTYFIPCSPHPSWPYSSAPRRHKWRHLVFCKGGMKEENYIQELEITALELNDNRGSEQNGRNDWKKSTMTTTPYNGKLISEVFFFFLHTFCTDWGDKKNVQGDIHHNRGRDVIPAPTMAAK